MKNLSYLLRPTKAVLLLVGLFVSASVYTYEAGPPSGYTNAPGEGNCSSCHTCTPITSGTEWSGITLTRVGGSLANIIPNASNPMSLGFSSSTSTKFGFQLCVLPASAGSSTASVGTLNTGTSSLVQTATSSSPTRVYLSHTSSGTAASSGTASWTFNWVTPSAYSGGATFYVVINETNDNSGSSGDQIYLKTFSTTVLPVRWLDFSAQELEDGIKLKWSTAMELNNKVFEVERSEDGEHFEYAGSVNGKGNANSISSYSYIDHVNTQHTWFYRIKQLDFDGKADYSRVIVFQPNKIEGPSVYLKTDEHKILVQTETPVDAIQIYNLAGKHIAKIAGDGSNQFAIPEDLKGVYLLYMQVGQQHYYKKFLF